MTREQMIEELLEKIESELEDLDNSQLSSLLTDYEDAPLLESVIEGLSPNDLVDEDADDESDAAIIDKNWEDDD